MKSATIPFTVDAEQAEVDWFYEVERGGPSLVVREGGNGR